MKEQKMYVYELTGQHTVKPVEAVRAAVIKEEALELAVLTCGGEEHLTDRLGGFWVRNWKLGMTFENARERKTYVITNIDFLAEVIARTLADEIGYIPPRL